MPIVVLCPLVPTQYLRPAPRATWAQTRTSVLPRLTVALSLGGLLALDWLAGDELADPLPGFMLTSCDAAVAPLCAVDWLIATEEGELLEEFMLTSCKVGPIAED